MNLGDYLREQSVSLSHGKGNRLGELLIRRGQIRKYQLDFMLELQKSYSHLAHPVRLGQLLVQHRAIGQKGLTEALKAQETLPKESITEIVQRLSEESEEEETKLL